MSQEALQKELDVAHSRLAQMERQVNSILDISRIAQETTDVGYFIQRCLEFIAKDEGWTVGQMWYLSKEGDSLQCSKQWYGTNEAADFRAASSERRFTKGIGLPGRVWGTGTAVWMEDVSTETGMSFTRAQVAMKAGLRSGFALPVRHGAEVTGVLEFFGKDKRPVDSAKLMFYEKIGTFLGAFFAEKRSAAEIYESGMLHRAILDRAHDAFIGMEQTGLIFAWNKRAEELFGWRRDEAIGQQLVDMIIPHRYREAHIKGLFRHLATGQGKVLNHRVQTPALHQSGKEIPIQLAIFPIDVLDRKRFGAFVTDVLAKPEPPHIVLE